MEKQIKDKLTAAWKKYAEENKFIILMMEDEHLKELLPNLEIKEFIQCKQFAGTCKGMDMFMNKSREKMYVTVHCKENGVVQGNTHMWKRGDGNTGMFFSFFDNFLMNVHEDIM